MQARQRRHLRLAEDLLEEQEAKALVTAGSAAMVPLELGPVRIRSLHHPCLVKGKPPA